jgi:protein TonB
LKVIPSQQSVEKVFGLFLVLILHAVVLCLAFSHNLTSPHSQADTLIVNLVNPLPPKRVDPPKVLPKKVILDKPKIIERPRPLPILVAETPDSEVEYMVPAPEPISLQETHNVDFTAPKSVQVMDASKSAMPIMMTTELSLACSKRTPPNYPAASRRMGEHGRVVLRVELDETGQITTVKVKDSSGYKRLDDAGIAVVKTWHCDAAKKNGQAQPAVALQPFDFILN